MSEKGADLVRRYLWNAAKSALLHNPAIHDLYARQRAKGKRGDVAMGHCMRKLLHQVFGVWASDQPFDEERSRGPGAQKSSTSDRPPSEAAEEAKVVAGHKRETSPQRKVVTATENSVESSSPSIKTADKGRGSIDYAYIREQITMQQILAHLGLREQLRCHGNEYRGPCPFHASSNPKSTSFSVSLDKNAFRCHNTKCGKQGNALDFWATHYGAPLYESTLALADIFNLQLTRNRREEAPVTQRP